MHRRDFISKAAVAPIVLTSVSGLGSSHFTSSLKTGKATFRFVAVSKQSGTADLLIINGAGSFNDHEVSGGGTFTYFHLTGTVPMPTHGFGTWEATKLQRFVLTQHPSLSMEVGGILELEVNLIGEVPKNATSPAVFKLIANTSNPSLATTHVEGVSVLKANGINFEPLAQVGGVIFHLY